MLHLLTNKINSLMQLFARKHYSHVLFYIFSMTDEQSCLNRGRVKNYERHMQRTV